MRTKGKNRVLAGALALFMSITAVSFSPINAESGSGDSGDKKYTLDTTSNLTSAAAGDFTDGQSATAGTENYFTLFYSTKTKIDSSGKSFDDGYSGSQRINFGGKLDADTPKNAISFTTKNAATVKVWWVEGGDDNRQITAVSSTGTTAYTSNETLAKNAACVSEFKLSDAGTYFLGGKENNNYFFKVEVTEHLPKEYVLDTTTDLTSASAGDFTDGQSANAGTKNYFTLFYSTKTKIDSSGKSFDDGYSGSQRINFGGKLDADTPKNAISFTTSGASKVKVWWVEGGDDNRQITVINSTGTAVYTSNETLAKNAACVSEFELANAGTYFLGGKENNNYFFKVQVIEGAATEVVRNNWADVAAPTITKTEQVNDKIEVTVSASIGANGGDVLKVAMFDKDGREIATMQSLRETESHALSFTPTASGNYTFKAVLSRKNETDKTSAESGPAAYVLPLGTPTISSATNKGSGSVEVAWGAVKEATGYKVYCNNVEAGTTSNTKYTVTGLTVGDSCSFTVAAVRDDEEGSKSKAFTTTVTEAEQRVWGYTIYGVSVDNKNNGFTGGVNEDGQVTVFSEGGKGKIVGGGADGLTFYYTAVPTENNFTLRAKMHVDSWTYSNGQEAMGMMVSDSIPETLLQNPFWTNVYYLSLGTIAYYWDPEKSAVSNDNIGTKYDMRFGLGVYPKIGITSQNQAQVGVDSTVTSVVDPNKQYPLETSAAQQSLAAGRYNIAAGVTNADKAPTAIAQISDFDIEIQRNNTGYFFTYYDASGNIIGKQKFYDRDALNALDGDNIYVGFFAARNARATFSDIQLTVTDPATDPPAEEKPVEKITPVLNIHSGSVANAPEYTLTLSSNVAGTAEISVKESYEKKTVVLTPDERVSETLKIVSGSNRINIIFTPDPDQDLGEGYALENAEIIEKNITVTYDTYFAGLENLYVSPEGTPYSNGSPEYPLDIYTAVNVARPGQKIVVMEGTYNLIAPVRIERGIDGTSQEPIYMIADPNAATRPVFDFQQTSMGFKAGGNYWYFQGFDVTNTANGQGGFYVNGNNITLDSIHAYNNGNTGIQISAFYNSSDPRELWPQNNLILNCVSHNNADAGYEDADGFAAKLTIGEGNVFDGCVSYNNADDGWDLYARASSGPIGAVTIRNCVAYGNGYLEDGTNAGNGNGFKLGGENLPGGHKLINSVSFNNKADGITSNSCPDVSVINCTSFNNAKSNLNLYTNSSGQETKFTVQGLVSFKYILPGRSIQAITDITTEDKVKTNTTDSSVYNTVDNFYWRGSQSTNSEGTALSESMFKSLVFEEDGDIGVARNADGTINLKDFLDLDLTAAPTTAKGAKFSADSVSTDPDNPIRTPSANIGVSEENNVLQVRPRTPSITLEHDGSQDTSTDESSPSETDTGTPSDTEDSTGDTNNSNNDKNVNTGVSVAYAPTALAALALSVSIIVKRRK